MARKLPAKEQIVKLIVGAGQASPSPPVGPALGSKGVKSIDFCKEFNALTAQMIPGTPIPALITVRPDRTFHFQLRTPPTAHLLLAAAGVPPGKGGRMRGANAPGRTSAGQEAVHQAPSASGKSVLASVGGPLSAKGGGTGEGAEVDVSALGASKVRMVAKGAGGEKGAGHGGGSTQVGEVSLKHVYEIARIKQGETRLGGLSLEGLVKSVVAQARSCGIGVVP